MKSKQTDLFDYFDTTVTRKRYGRTQHGGARAKGHRKLERPLSTRKWIHLVLKSGKAKGDFSLLSPRNRSFVDRILRDKARTFGVRVDQLVNVGNHLHLKIKISHREGFQKFLKSTTAQIARHVTRARRGKPFGKFWQGLAFTRILTSSLEELNLRGYLHANQLEATHSLQARESFLKEFNAWVYRERPRSQQLTSAFSSLLLEPNSSFRRDQTLRFTLPSSGPPSQKQP